MCTGAQVQQVKTGLTKITYKDMRMEQNHDQQNRGEIFAGELCRCVMCNTIGVDIFTTRNKEYRRRACRHGEDSPGKKFVSLLFGKSKYLTPLIGTISEILVKKDGLGLQNPMTSVENNCPSFKLVGMELNRAMTGEGELSIADHLLSLRK